MATSATAPTRANNGRDHDHDHDHDRGTVQRSTETKSAVKTTELIVYVAAVVAMLVASAIVDQNDAGGFGTRQVWLYITILTVGYMVSRGLAKSGSRDPYTENR